MIASFPPLYSSQNVAKSGCSDTIWSTSALKAFGTFVHSIHRFNCSSVSLGSQACLTVTVTSFPFVGENVIVPVRSLSVSLASTWNRIVESFIEDLASAGRIHFSADLSIVCSYPTFADTLTAISVSPGLRLNSCCSMTTPSWVSCVIFMLLLSVPQVTVSVASRASS